ncbi:hypothetical protein [Streptomyces sp. C1-2]|uniref:hypothetical protein n=1 Tax=Streptomyces sp. C1-2 TaxID=2720022 RepID=UPI0014323765|nr:hypothetical protein [Streptomyces sp. C1-2]NJP70408.1 hypothetical protein [Streptomyces sp. C1-2]
MWFVSRRRYEEALATADRLRDERDKARAQRSEFRTAAVTAGRQLAEADATNRRLDGRVLELGRRISALTEADPEYLAELEQELAAEKRRADQLQTRLDDAVGLGADRIADSGPWQPARTSTKGATS